MVAMMPDGSSSASAIASSAGVDLFGSLNATFMERVSFSVDCLFAWPRSIAQR
jgi:hypothetical protein